MNKLRISPLVLVALCGCLAAQQPPASSPNEAPGQAGFRRGPMDPSRGTMGEITQISASSITLKLQDGSTSTVSLTPDTRFRKGRDEAKLSDFKVGDRVAVRGQSTGTNQWSAQAVMAMPSQAEMQQQRERMQQEMGKTIVIGKVAAIDPPKITVHRMDDVDQTIEADEGTSIRKGRDESITLPDIKVGDTVFARGALKSGVFVPTQINVVDPNMANRMRGMAEGYGGGGDRLHSGQGASAPQSGTDTPKQ